MAFRRQSASTSAYENVKLVDQLKAAGRRRNSEQQQQQQTDCFDNSKMTGGELYVNQACINSSLLKSQGSFDNILLNSRSIMHDEINPNFFPRGQTKHNDLEETGADIKRPPAIPKRNPETRLSTNSITSQSSISSDVCVPPPSQFRDDADSDYYSSGQSFVSDQIYMEIEDVQAGQLSKKSTRTMLTQTSTPTNSQLDLVSPQRQMSMPTEWNRPANVQCNCPDSLREVIKGMKEQTSTPAQLPHSIAKLHPVQSSPTTSHLPTLEIRDYRVPSVQSPQMQRAVLPDVMRSSVATPDLVAHKVQCKEYYIMSSSSGGRRATIATLDSNTHQTVLHNNHQTVSQITNNNFCVKNSSVACMNSQLNGPSLHAGPATVSCNLNAVQHAKGSNGPNKLVPLQSEASNQQNYCDSGIYDDIINCPVKSCSSVAQFSKKLNNVHLSSPTSNNDFSDDDAHDYDDVIATPVPDTTNSVKISAQKFELHDSCPSRITKTTEQAAGSPAWKANISTQSAAPRYGSNHACKTTNMPIPLPPSGHMPVSSPPLGHIVKTPPPVLTKNLRSLSPPPPPPLPISEGLIDDDVFPPPPPEIAIPERLEENGDKNFNLPFTVKLKAVKPSVNKNNGTTITSQEAYAAPAIHQTVNNSTLSVVSPSMPTSIATSSISREASSPQSKCPPPTLPKSKVSSVPDIIQNVPDNGNNQPTHAAQNKPTTGKDSSKASSKAAGPINIDVTSLPGYQVIPEGCAVWKVALIEKKNKQIVDEARALAEKRLEEEEKWAGIPDWKKKLMQEKEKKK